ncbi:hypothetical protein AYI69_g11590 [Smittium culicis]|uniref:Homing endonuclease LAGLIDADG domain-containing protein n=1 Tax=Smittium culicis TaxID=133412 RepID=A0A1R1WXD9_9FUNG|nr:hypothetical protein AYI69_g11590 [Smittium culicis]
MQLKKTNCDSFFSIDILPPSSFSLLDNHWLAGFTDADGCFCITIVKSKTGDVSHGPGTWRFLNGEKLIELYNVKNI